MTAPKGKIIFFGTPEFSVASLRALKQSGEDIALVVTRPDKPKGRTRVPTPPPVKEEAQRLGLGISQPASMKDAEFIAELKSISPEFIVTVAYGKILTKEILLIPSIAPVNVHASLLPKCRGASPIAWAIINGETVTGVTTMLMSEGLDEGDILLSEQTPIGPEETSEELGERLAEIGAGLLVKTLDAMRNGKIKPVPQKGGASYAPILKKSDGIIDWTKTAPELVNFIRGMRPWPGAKTKIGAEAIAILKAKAESGAAKPGEVAEADGKSLKIGTGKGLLSIEELKPEGKNPMSIGAFLQGRNIRKGDILG